MYKTTNHFTELTKSSVAKLQNPVKSAELKKNSARKPRNDLRFTELKTVRCKNKELLRFDKKPFFRV
jgi:hypothetical protein